MEIDGAKCGKTPAVEEKKSNIYDMEENPHMKSMSVYMILLSD